MKIQIDPHTLQRAEERGTNKDEIKEVLVNGYDITAKRYKKAKAKVYKFNQNRLNKFYKQKRVEVIYTIESDKIVTITVYVFYGNWKEQQ